MIPRRARSLFRLLGIALLAAGLACAAAGLWIPVKAVMAQHLLDRAFTASLNTGHVVKPWSWADTWPVARVSVPRLGISVVVLAGDSGQALAFGPGHVNGTARPGEPGTAVFAAHRDTHFDFLDQLNHGDVIEVQRTDGVIAHYTVQRTAVVRWDRSGIDPDEAGQHLVLATCWPLHATTPGDQRYLVVAQATPR
ncbi:MAG: class GN sortase [Nevskiaceae bacterium]|nr:class GN sortase [Nevskiaceae bacterium]